LRAAQVKIVRAPRSQSIHISRYHLPHHISLYHLPPFQSDFNVTEARAHNGHGHGIAAAAIIDDATYGCDKFEVVAAGG
jgi:hypothetical protein